MATQYELIIIGGGPAGTAAAVYAARKQIQTAIITPAFGGQSGVSPEIYNWIGTPAISGADLDKSFEKHARAHEGEFLEIITGNLVSELTHQEKDGEKIFSVKVGEATLTSKSVLIVSGSSRRKLSIPGAEEFENKGVVYCATCDGPLFSGQDVVVIGGGNAGFETALQLTAYCKSVTLLHRSASYKADEVTVEKTLAKENFTGLLMSESAEIHGDKFVTGITYKNKETDEVIKLDATGIFVEIGQIPNTQYISDSLVGLDDYKKIKVDPRTQRTDLLGLWAAGDVTDGLYHQNNIAAGDAVKALEDIYIYLHTGK